MRLKEPTASDLSKDFPDRPRRASALAAEGPKWTFVAPLTVCGAHAMTSDAFWPWYLRCYLKNASIGNAAPDS
ncbi:hypothetical protein RV134_320195 [Roseovarius sp. EC-HK134]|nr:hypothetical protein RV420_380124 [Roseovarius sp. EC-SD190]VVT23878.1 hypothetical protein RV134_320195 [Roseovarius sp. EC-HK134]